MQKNKKLPIGIQTFANLIEEGYLYVDKTPFIHKLTEQGKYYFLSRPRRFGKSLFISTLKSAFEGRRNLFQGLFLYDNRDWSKINPVMHISFGSGVMGSVDDLEIRFSAILDNHVRLHGLQLFQDDLRERFADICGYTQDDLERVFSGWMGKDVDLAKVRTWYNGYSWLGREVYNPFDRNGIFQRETQCGAL